jgi:Ca2+-binding RTX toxin-like protein
MLVRQATPPRRKATTMSHTTTRPRRLARLAAGLAVTAGATATTLLGASPAHAQGSSVTASVTGGLMIVTGTQFGDNVSASGGFGTVSLSTLSTSLKAGTGCTQLGAVVRCNGVSSISFSGLGGADKFDAGQVRQTAVNARGGSGNDIFIGGSGSDRLSGGSGTDQADGRTGSDTCTAESEVRCEL